MEGRVEGGKWREQEEKREWEMELTCKIRKDSFFININRIKIKNM